VLLEDRRMARGLAKRLLKPAEPPAPGTAGRHHRRPIGPSRPRRARRAASGRSTVRTGWMPKISTLRGAGAPSKRWSRNQASRSRMPARPARSHTDPWRYRSARRSFPLESTIELHAPGPAALSASTKRQRLRAIAPRASSGRAARSAQPKGRPASPARRSGRAARRTWQPPWVR